MQKENKVIESNINKYNKPNKDDFSGIKQCGDLIVLFSSGQKLSCTSMKGITLNKAGGWNIGEFSDTWNGYPFHPFEGEVTLKNK